MNFSKSNIPANREDIQRMISKASDELNDESTEALRESLSAVERWITKRDLANLLDRIKKERVETGARARTEVLKVIASGQVDAVRESVRTQLQAHKGRERDWLISYLRDLLKQHQKKALANAEEVGQSIANYIDRAESIDNEFIKETLIESHRETYVEYVEWHRSALEKIRGVINEKINRIDQQGGGADE